MVNPVIQNFYENVVGPYWPPERRHVDEGYRSFDFPFEEFQAPPRAIRGVCGTLDDLIGYVDRVVGGARRRAGAWTLAGRRLSS